MNESARWQGRLKGSVSGKAESLCKGRKTREVWCATGTQEQWCRALLPEVLG